MSDAVFYSFCVISALIYSLSAMCLKRAMQQGVGAVRTVFVTLWMLLVCFAPLLFLVERGFHWDNIWQPMLAGTVSFMGSLTTTMAIRVGDVTIQAPMMGIKIVIVAFLTVMLGAGVVPLPWWIAASLASLAVFILGFSGIHNKRATLLTAMFAILASTFFAIEDVLIQKWAPDYGPIEFMFMLMVMGAAYSFLLIPFFRWNLRDISATGWKWLLLGTFLMALQAVLFYLPIAIRGEATVVNIIYSSRGIWSIVLVWCIGSWFGNAESSAGNRIMLQRLVGACLLLVAIVLVLVY